MKLYFVFIPVILILAIAACDNTGKKSDPVKTTPAADKVEKECYIRIIDRDTFSIEVVQSKNFISGILIFDNYQKDGSSGKIHGTTHGNIIKLWYNFASEGINSIMEVYFKKEGQTLIRGIGDMKLRNDSTFYSNPTQIIYPAKEAFKKTFCK